jgi:AraC family transcriptional activator FtrA
MAKRAAVSPRTLQRLFLDSTGLPIYAWLLQERIAVAKAKYPRHFSGIDA